MARAFIILYVLMGIYYLSNSAHVQEARAVDLTGEDTMQFSDYTETSSNTSRQTRAAGGREPASCGWYVEFSGKTDIVHKIPDGVEYFSCIWVVYPKTSGPIQVNNVYDSSAQFDSSSFSVVVETSLSSATSTWARLGLNSVYTVNFADAKYNFFYIFLTGKRTKGSQGIHLKLSDSGSKAHTGFPPLVKFLQFDRSSGAFKYPPGSTATYKNNERTFIIGYIPEGRNYDISIKTDLEDCCDKFLLSWYTRTYEKYTFRHGGSTTYPGRTVPHGTSYVMAFLSDGSAVRSGVRVTYENIDDSANWHE